MRYPLASSTWNQTERLAIQKVVDSGQFTMGQNVRQFEADFCRYTGAKYCVMVNSGSSANLLAVAAPFYSQANPLRRGDEAIVPAVSWSTTYCPFHQYGMKVKFVDVDGQTLNYCLDDLAAAVSSRTRVIMAVNLLGNPNDFDRIRQIIGRRDILLLEDNCESMGAQFEGRMAGTFGRMGTFSAFFSHHICTMEGGIVVTDDEELYHILLCLRAHGWTRDLPKHNRVCDVKSDNPFQESFRFVLPGYNVRPLEMSAAVGIEQLKKLPEFLRVRRENARRFKELFADVPGVRTQREVGLSSWFGFSMILEENAPIDRDALVALLMDNGIECRPIVAGNFVANSVVRWFDQEVHGTLRNANFLDRRGLFVGNHHYDLSGELAFLKEVVCGALRPGRRTGR